MKLARRDEIETDPDRFGVAPERVYLAEASLRQAIALKVLAPFGLYPIVFHSGAAFHVAQLPTNTGSRTAHFSGERPWLWAVTLLANFRRHRSSLEPEGSWPARFFAAST